LAVNQAIQGGAEKATISKVLEGDTLSQTHAVTSEKLADLYRELNRPEDARNAYERTLLLNPSDNQRNRVLLTLAEIDLRSGKTASALDRMELLLQKDPAYPEKTNLLRSMLEIAENSGFSKRAASISERESSPGVN
jgi:tetratricopeptide (TPR) repeat protein